jgi:histidinol-phosphate aminotransferase
MNPSNPFEKHLEKHPQLPLAKHGGADGSSFMGLDFSVNTNPFGPNPILLAAAHAADLEHYPDPHYSRVKHALSTFHALELKNIDSENIGPENIVLAVGASELLHRIARAFMTQKSRAVSIFPAFGEFERAVQLEGGHLYTTTPEHALTLLEEVKPALVYTSRPNNPLGLSLERDLLLRVADWCLAHSSVLVLDQAYTPFVPHLERIPHHPALLHLESPGKVHGLVGLRMAYAVCAAPIAQALENLAPAWVLPASTAAALEALPHAQDFVLRTVPQLLELSQNLAQNISQRLSSLTQVHHTRTPFFTLEVEDAAQITSELLKLGIRVRDCSSFGFPKRIRVSAKLEGQNEVLIRALEGFFS